MPTVPNRPPAKKVNGGLPLYKVFRTQTQSYLYDTATNQILTIPDGLARYLEQGAFGPEELDEFAAGHRGGILTPTSALPLSSGPDLAEVERAVRHQCRQVVLEITRDCNMRCRYCVYSGLQPDRRGRSEQTMSLDTARKAVDYLRDHSSDVPNVALGFFGGEPLLVPPLLREITDYARAVLKGKDLTFSLTTNGTLLRRDAMDFLAASDFSTLVSLDGPADINDENRIFAGGSRGSHDIVISALREFRDAHPDYYRRRVRLSMVAPPGTDYPRVVEWLRAHRLEVAMSSLAVDDTGEFDRLYHKRPTTGLEQLRCEFADARCDGTLNHDKGRSAFSLHTVLFSSTLWVLRARRVPTSPTDRAIRRGVCIPSSERLFVDCTGNLFPCEKTDGKPHLRLGHIDSGIDPRRAHEITVEFHDFLAGECASCWLWRLCRICPAGLSIGGSYSREQARRLCEAHRDGMTAMLELYCSILERKPDALDYFLNTAKPSGARP